MYEGSQDPVDTGVGGGQGKPPLLRQAPGKNCQGGFARGVNRSLPRDGGGPPLGKVVCPGMTRWQGWESPAHGADSSCLAGPLRSQQGGQLRATVSELPLTRCLPSRAQWTWVEAPLRV